MAKDTDISNISTSDLARMLAAQRKRVDGECSVCGKPISGVAFHGEIARLYCSERCRKAAYRYRKKQSALDADADTARA